MQTHNNKTKQQQDENMTDIDKTLEERGTNYGEFCDHAKISQGMKAAMHESNNWFLLSDDKKEALEMVAHKIGRILNGNPEFHDSWRDIIGYVRLIEKDLERPDKTEEALNRSRQALRGSEILAGVNI
ncbi:MAG: hypothetical protein V3R32_04105 [Nitrosomonadaceae bacterium]